MKQGRASLDGNGARDFLKAIPNLELELYKKGGQALINGLQVVSVGQAFNKVKDSCLGMELEPGWRGDLKDFRVKYRQTEMSVTPKVHMVERHIEDFINLKGENHGKYLFNFI